MILPGSGIACDSHSSSAFVLLQIMNLFSPRKNGNGPMAGNADGGYCVPWPGAGDKTGDNERVNGLRAGAGLAGHPRSHQDEHPSPFPVLYSGQTAGSASSLWALLAPGPTLEARIQPGVRAHPLP